MGNCKTGVRYASVIIPVLIGMVCAARAEPVLPQQQQTSTRGPSADMQIKSLLDNIEGQLGQDQPNFDEVINLLVTACNILPAASRTGQQMVSDLPQRLSTRSKEQREAGLLIKSINIKSSRIARIAL